MIVEIVGLAGMVLGFGLSTWQLSRIDRRIALQQSKARAPFSMEQANPIVGGAREVVPLVTFADPEPIEAGCGFVSYPTSPSPDIVGVKSRLYPDNSVGFGVGVLSVGSFHNVIVQPHVPQQNRIRTFSFARLAPMAVPLRSVKNDISSDISRVTH